MAAFEALEQRFAFMNTEIGRGDASSDSDRSEYDEVLGDGERTLTDELSM